MPRAKAALGFPEALTVDRVKMDDAMTESLVPHAIILTERSVPQPIFVAALIGIDRILRVDLDLSKRRQTFPEQVRDALRGRMGGNSGRAVPAFGNVTGFVVNYGPDRAVRFDLDGSNPQILDRAVRVGTASASIGGRKAPEGMFIGN